MGVADDISMVCAYTGWICVRVGLSKFSCYKKALSLLHTNDDTCYIWRLVDLCVPVPSNHTESSRPRPQSVLVLFVLISTTIRRISEKAME